MKKTTKMLSLLIAVCMMITLLPAVALAETQYDLWVGGVQVTSGNANDITGTGISVSNGGKVSYDAATNTLTLNNAKITGHYRNEGISTNTTALTINLVGNNEVIGQDNNGSSNYGMYIRGALNFTGTGSLTASAEPGNWSVAILAMGDITVGTGCTITATCGTNSGTAAPIYPYSTGSIVLNGSRVTASTDASGTPQISNYNENSLSTSNLRTYKYLKIEPAPAGETYTVTFGANGGSGTMDAQTFTKDVQQNLTANAFTRSGYTFSGWNTAADGSGTAYADGAAVTLTDSGLTLYAQWTASIVRGTYIEGSNGLKYCYTSGGNFDIKGMFDGKVKSTTYNDAGYRTYVRTGESDYLITAQPSYNMYTVGNTGLKVGIDLSFEGEGDNSIVKIKYTVTNTTDEDISYALGSGADVKIGSDDSAVITALDTCNGFKMVSDNSSDKDSQGEYAQFNFFGSGEGITDITSYWYGAYGSSYTNHWSGNYQNAILKYGEAERSSGNFDSAATWRWDGKTIAAGATDTYTVAVGVGGMGSEEAVVDEAVINGSIFGTCRSLAVELKNLNGRVVEATVTAPAEGSFAWGYTAEVPRGRYNIVATATDENGNTVTVTKLVSITENTTQDLTLPTAQENSKIEDSSTAFNAIVGGVDTIANAQDENAPVTITLKVSDVADSGAGVGDIKAAAGDKVLDFVDFTLLKQVGNGTPEDIGDENDTMLTIMLKYDTGKQDIKVYRYHDNEVEELNKISATENNSSIQPVNSSAPDSSSEGFWLGNGFICIRAYKFSTYAIASAKPGATDVNPDKNDTPTVPTIDASSGINLWYEGGNSFGSSNSAVPSSVKIDGVEVGFTGNGSRFTVNSLPGNAKWVTVSWNSTSVTTNFTPDANAYSTEVTLPKTGSVSAIAFVLMAVAAAAGVMGKK